MTFMENQNHSIHCERPSALETAWNKFSQTIAAWLHKRALRQKQIENRRAFMSLVGKEDWVYRDMGVHAGDVDWASKLPLHLNAAKELDRIRRDSTYGR